MLPIRYGEMHAAIDPELAARLATAEQPAAAPPMPPVSLRMRLTTSPSLRRLLPSRMMMRRAEARGRTLWAESPKGREQAHAAIGPIVGGTPRVGEIEQLARRHLVEKEAQKTLFWQPWSTAKMDPTSTAHLHEALASNRGVLLSTCHLGPFFMLMSVVTMLGYIPYAVAAPWFFAKPSPDYWGRRLARWRQQTAARGERLVPSEGSFAVLRTLLERGSLVNVYFDMPGSRETSFLGKPVMLASGTARLALETDALVLPMRARRERHRVWVDVEAPLDPHEFAGVDDMHDTLAAIHEHWVLELPATLEDPNRPGAWEQSATAEAWRRPSPRQIR
jgi:hypothetical protein